MWPGVIVFAITYVLIASRRIRWLPIDRPAGALIGAVLAIALGAVTPAQAAVAVDQSTLVLLFAVMGMGAFLSADGFFERAAPVATAANTGSVATLVGNPQNMLCGNLGSLSFSRYLLHMLPVAIAGLAINQAILRLLFRRELEADLPREPVDGALFTIKSAVTLIVIFACVVAYIAGTNLTVTALAGFIVLLLLHRAEPSKVWERIDWSVLLFFGGLFVAVDGFARSGASAWVFARAPLFLGPEGVAAYARTAAYFLVGSNVVTNVPFILIVREQMAALPNPTLGWELLAMASTFAGNLTLLGSVANIIVAEKSQSIGGLRFREYLKAGAPIAIATTAVGTLWLVAIR